MRGSIRLCTVFGININIHVSFFLLLLLVLPGGIRWAVLVGSVFALVTAHELCHSLVAKVFGVHVKEITLLPIGGLASMSRMPDKPLHELAISVAGPLFNIIMLAVFFYPVRAVVGDEVLFHGFSTATWPHTIAYIYWINLVLAGFNMLPAFPMDGGRVLRSILAIKLGNLRATRIAAWIGRLFAVLFAASGLINLNVVLIAVGVFIYISASAEEIQAAAAYYLSDKGRMQ